MMVNSGLRAIYFTKGSIKKDTQVDVSGAKNLVLDTHVFKCWSAVY